MVVIIDESNIVNILLIQKMLLSVYQSIPA